jgi:catechol 2,3-dioxygenase-like lactoylglutathione lyase family enzyme
MTTLHPRGVNHLALSTADMKGQLTFWCDVLGLPLKALYWMHGVDNTFHGFVELAGDSYVAFVQHPDNTAEVEFGVSHADGAGGGVRGGTMQHVAFHVDCFDELLAMRDRIRSKGVEVTCGEAIDERALIDPEVVALCGIDTDELETLKQPAPFDRPVDAVPQPAEPFLGNIRAEQGGPRYAQVMALSDEFVWDRLSVTDPPVPSAENGDDAL